MTGTFRLPQGGRIDRSRPLSFRFDGRSYQGYQGDTLAAALLANGVHLVGRSFKYHRPRGIMAAGAEEPNALVQVGEDPRTDPNVKATPLELVDGLKAEPQNADPEDPQWTAKTSRPDSWTAGQAGPRRRGRYLGPSGRHRFEAGFRPVCRRHSQAR